METSIIKEKLKESHFLSKEVNDIHQLVLSLHPSFELNADELRLELRRKLNQEIHILELIDNNKIIGFFDFAICECFAWGKYLYVYDLVLDPTQRSKSYGQKFLAYLHNYAKRNHCSSIRLDSKLERVDARRFYIKNGYDIFAFHYVKNIQ